MVNFSENFFKLFLICCADIMLINLLLKVRKRDERPFLEKMEGCSFGGINGLINWAGEEMYIRCFSGILIFLGPDIALFPKDLNTFMGEKSEVEIKERGETDRRGWKGESGGGRRGWECGDGVDGLLLWDFVWSFLPLLCTFGVVKH